MAKAGQTCAHNNVHFCTTLSWLKLKSSIYMISDHRHHASYPVFFHIGWRHLAGRGKLGRRCPSQRCSSLRQKRRKLWMMGQVRTPRWIGCTLSNDGGRSCWRTVLPRARDWRRRVPCWLSMAGESAWRKHILTGTQKLGQVSSFLRIKIWSP